MTIPGTPSLALPALLLESENSGNTPWLWGIFAIVVVTVMALDLGVFHRKAHRVSAREAGAWVTVWVSLALLFNAGIWMFQGPQHALEFLTGYIVELSLSVDNIFVFVFIFSYFAVPPEYQHRVLFWGILGAVLMRMLFIFTAVELLEHFDFLVYIFGAFLVYTGVKFLFHAPEIHPEKNLLLRVAKRFLGVTPGFHGEHFFVRLPVEPKRPATDSMEAVPRKAAPMAAPTAGGGAMPRLRLFATPLFLVLMVVEATDVVFAVDSVPAILGITQDRFIAYTSNIFAILGLRSMYFLLVSFLDKFHLLKFGLSFVLIFIGTKMLIHGWVPITAGVSLAVVVSMLGGSVVLSLLIPPRKSAVQPGTAAEDSDED